VDLPKATGVFDSLKQLAMGNTVPNDGNDGYNSADGGNGNITLHNGTARGNNDFNDTEPMKPKRVKEVCFTCWSRGQGAKCDMHLPPGEKDRPVPPGQSVLVCGNWDIASISRKNRSEEIQEVSVALRRCVFPCSCIDRASAVLSVRDYHRRSVRAVDEVG
jgi:hypothetical protein